MASTVGRIVGPPGTGKTTEILRLIGAACEKYDPGKIGACSLTKAAVQEMRHRVFGLSGVDGAVNRNIRTMHSHAFMMLGMQKGRIAETRIKEWNEEHPGSMINPGPMAKAVSEVEHNGTAAPLVNGRTVAEELLVSTTLKRLRMIPQERWAVREQHFYKKWRRWMDDNLYMDYTGMLEEVLEKSMCPDIDILFVDEAQDMSPLQCAITRKWSESTNSTIYAGDYQQAIFRFAGASPEVFLDLEHTWPKNLTKSYRVPKNILNYAKRIIGCATDYGQFEYSPRDGDDGELLGRVIYPDLRLDGSHMLICRYRAQVLAWADILIEHGIPFKNDYRPTESTWNPCSTKIWGHAVTYKSLISGRNVSGKDLAALFGSMRARGNFVNGSKQEAIQSISQSQKYNLFNIDSIHGVDQSLSTHSKKMEDIFTSQNSRSSTLLRRVWNNPEKIINPPSVTLGTIHSVKGGEADNVWIESRINKGQLKQIYINDLGRTAVNDEYRIAYVAATRARRRLGFVESSGLGQFNPFLCMG